MTQVLITVNVNVRALLALLLLFGFTPLQAAEQTILSGVRQINLLDKQGQRFPIGQIVFSGQGIERSYRLQLDHHRFTDHFLSMKELKCLEGDELWCQVPYPYANPHSIRQDDLRWLEHDLLFLFKRNGEFGANFWNGIYYRLQWHDGRLLGEARAIDLNALASPPDDLTTPPLAEIDLEEADLAKRWLPQIEIR